MKFLRKLKSGNFWVSIISACVLIAEVVFDFEIKTDYLNQILLGILGILTMFGIVSDHGGNEAIVTNGDSKETKQDSPDNFSNIKSICDTISLMLNKVSINSDTKVEEKFENNIAQDNVKIVTENKEKSKMETFENAEKPIINELNNSNEKEVEQVSIVEHNVEEQENTDEKINFEEPENNTLTIIDTNMEVDKTIQIQNDEEITNIVN